MTDKAALKTSPKKSSGTDAGNSRGATASSSVKLPLLEEINHRFQGFLSQRLKALLLHDVGVEAVPLTVIKADDYLLTAKKKGLVVSSSCRPLDGMALITLESGLLDTLVDNYFGGHGEYARDDLGKGFSFVEYRMAERVLSSIFTAYEIVFSPLKNILFGFVGFQVNPLEDKTVSSDESLIVSRFKVDTGSGSAFFELCFQNRTLLPVKKELAEAVPAGFFDKLAVSDDEENDAGKDKEKKKSSRAPILARLKPVALASLINSEHPQVKAVVLSSLKPEIAIKALTHVPFGVLSSLISRLSTLNEIPSQAGCDFNAIIKVNLIKVKEAKSTPINGIRYAASLLKLFPEKIRELVLNSISGQNPKLSLSIRYRLVEFAELFKLEPLSLQELLRNINYSTLQHAMSVLGTPQRELLYKNMSQKIAGELKKDLAAMKPLEKTAVTEARQEILDVACSLADKEAIVLIAEKSEKDK